MRALSSLVTVVLLLAACGDDDAGGADAGGRDALVPDLGPVDGGGMADVGSPDGAVDPDAGPVDTGPCDDAASPDAAVDATRPDAGECVDPPPGPSRPVAFQCSPCRLPGMEVVGGGGDCATDADCTAGVNGRCGYSRIGGSCSYDVCMNDADCAPAELCACDGGFGGGNACIEAQCHVDADCAGRPCSPSLGDCGHYFPPVGYYCHTASDACQRDEDCPGGYCAYMPLLGHWECSAAECVG